MEEPARHSRYALLDSYRRALGMLAGTPLGDAAMDRAEAETGSARPEGVSRRGRKPRSFAEQPVHQPRPRGRPRKGANEALADARLHLGEEEPAGTA